jgi:hypothetical protein
MTGGWRAERLIAVAGRPPAGAAQQDPAERATGDEPMMAAQESYLTTLAHEAGEDVPGNLTMARAFVLIDRLQGRSQRLKGS